MNENIPSLDEIMMAWNEKCQSLNCEDCKLKDDAFRHSCKARYTHAILTGEMTLTDSFKKEEPKPKFPAWCKEGQWVTDACPDENEVNDILMIAGLSDDGSLAHVKGGDGREYLANVAGLKPVRFRPYTYEEARKLLGKVMEYQMNESRRALDLVTSVDGGEGLDIHINCDNFDFLSAGHATIDGIPIGVPEVDEELLKGGAE